MITGPVGGGKSFTGRALTDELQRRGCKAAVIDLDQVYGFVRQIDGVDDDAAWQMARSGAAALSTEFFDKAISTVIVEGEFFTPEELGALLGPIAADVRRDIYTLKVSYETAWKRVQGDPTRGISKNPAFLKSMSVKFERALTFLSGVSTVVEADALSPAEIVGELVGRLGRHEKLSS